MNPALGFSLSDFYVTRCRAYRYGNRCKSKERNVILKDSLFLVDCHLLFSSHPPLLLPPAY